MKKIFALTDYKGHFGSKHSAVPYKSGMDIETLKKIGFEMGYELVFMDMSGVDFSREGVQQYKGHVVLYTSQEDTGGFYKDYIEDVVLGLESIGAITLPSFKFLRAHNNKSFMEIFLKELVDEPILLRSYSLGTLEEAKLKLNELVFPIVLKSASGAGSVNVSLVNNESELINEVKRISLTRNIKKDMWDFGRSIKRKGYKRESRYRRKFILQEFVPGLENDWKVLIYGNRFYCLKRYVRDKDFRASGSGKFQFSDEIPDGLLQFAQKIYNMLKLPNASLDICFNGEKFYLIEFQAIYFGTTTIEYSKFYYEFDGDKFLLKKGESILEREYLGSIINYIERGMKQ